MKLKRADLNKAMDLSTQIHDLETMVKGIDMALARARDENVTGSGFLLHAYTTRGDNDRVGEVAITLTGNTAWNALTDLKRHVNLEIERVRRTLATDFGVED